LLHDQTVTPIFLYGRVRKAVIGRMFSIAPLYGNQTAFIKKCEKLYAYKL